MTLLLREVCGFSMYMTCNQPKIRLAVPVSQSIFSPLFLSEVLLYEFPMALSPVHSPGFVATAVFNGTGHVQSFDVACAYDHFLKCKGLHGNLHNHKEWQMHTCMLGSHHRVRLGVNIWSSYIQ